MLSNSRIPFEIVALEDAKIFLIADIELAMEMYYNLLDACGWSILEYEKELLSRIDKDWEDRCLS